MKKTLAASFLVTVGMGCSSAPPQPPGNPPMPPPTTVEPTPEPTDPVDVETPEPTDGGEAGNDLPQPGPNDKVVTKKDGTCWVMPEVDCPPSPATCNPPPPMQVDCPEEQ